MGKEYLLSDKFVALFSITIYLQAVWEIVYKYRTVFGDYKRDRNYMVASAISNIIVSILGAKYFHLCGWKIEQCNQLKIKILYTI